MEDSYSSFISMIRSVSPTVAVIGATVFGAVAHAIEEVKRSGWKGWISFTSDVVVCSFVGYVFFHIVALVSPEYAVVASSIGSYWGTKGFIKIRDGFFDTIVKFK